MSCEPPRKKEGTVLIGEHEVKEFFDPVEVLTEEYECDSNFQYKSRGTIVTKQVSNLIPGEIVCVFLLECKLK